MRFHALPPDVEHPVVITYTCFLSGFTTCNHLLHPVSQLPSKVNSAQQRFTNNNLMLYRNSLINRQAIIPPYPDSPSCSRWSHSRILAPVRRQALLQSVYPFGDKEKTKVLPYPYHLPCFVTPFIGIFNQEIGSETSIYQIARWNLIRPVLFFATGRLNFSVFVTTELSFPYLPSVRYT